MSRPSAKSIYSKLTLLFSVVTPAQFNFMNDTELCLMINSAKEGLRSISKQDDGQTSVQSGGITRNIIHTNVTLSESCLV